MELDFQNTSSPVEWAAQLIGHAIANRWTDLKVRLDRAKSVLSVYARVNRIMQEVAHLEGRHAVAVVTHIKSSARVSSAEAAAISDGLYVYRTGDTSIDIRVAVFPTYLGETIAMRLPAMGEAPKLADVNFNEHNAARIQRLLSVPNGLIVMAGPMGAGKTTTMYALLNELGSSERSVFSVEDPIERGLDGVDQIAINDAAGNGWADVLRGLRRSDLEVLMIGEIRDREQASAALEIGNAGARVVSSIHANDSVGAVEQLLELSGAQPRTLGNQLRGAISQRLLRTICTECLSVGCESCDNTGYSGVRPVHEVLIVDDDLVSALKRGASASELRDVAAQNGMQTLRESAQLLIDEGVTTPDEARRVLGDD